MIFTQEAPLTAKWFSGRSCNQDRIGIWKCWFLGRGENRSTRRKTSRSRVENQQQTQPTYDVESGNRTRATLVGGECFHHCANPLRQLSQPTTFTTAPPLRQLSQPTTFTTAPTLLPLVIYSVYRA